MTGDACPIPTQPDAREEAAIQRMLKAARIAVVGLSDNPSRPSYDVASYLQDQGHQIIPINPRCREVLGEPCRASLAELTAPPDVVLVFREPEACAQVAREAIAAGAKGIWLQAGIRNEEAQRLAAEAHIDFVQDRCMGVEHRRRH